MKKLLLAPRRFAQGVLYIYSNYISLLFLPRCRFYPSCSRYAHEAIGCHGLVFGARLALCRLLKCHPWHPGGFDPVPKERRKGCHPYQSSESEQ